MKLTTILLATAFFTSTAFAQFGRYTPNHKDFFIGVGYGFASDGAYEGGDFDALNVDELIAIELGYKKTYQSLTLSFSAEVMFGEGETLYSNAVGAFEYDSNNVGVFANIKAEYEISDQLSIYAGAGIGGMSTDLELAATDFVDIYGIEGNEGVLAYQFMVGAEFKPIDQLGIYVQYRYMSGQDLENFDFTVIEDSFVDVGARFYF